MEIVSSSAASVAVPTPAVRSYLAELEGGEPVDKVLLKINSDRQAGEAEIAVALMALRAGHRVSDDNAQAIVYGTAIQMLTGGVAAPSLAVVAEYGLKTLSILTLPGDRIGVASNCLEQLKTSPRSDIRAVAQATASPPARSAKEHLRAVVSMQTAGLKWIKEHEGKAEIPPARALAEVGQSLLNDGSAGVSRVCTQLMRGLSYTSNVDPTISRLARDLADIGEQTEGWSKPLLQRTFDCMANGEVPQRDAEIAGLGGDLVRVSPARYDSDPQSAAWSYGVQDWVTTAMLHAPPDAPPMAKSEMRSACLDSIAQWIDVAGHTAARQAELAQQRLTAAKADETAAIDAAKRNRRKDRIKVVGGMAVVFASVAAAGILSALSNSIVVTPLTGFGVALPLILSGTLNLKAGYRLPINRARLRASQAERAAYWANRSAERASQWRSALDKLAVGNQSEAAAMARPRPGWPSLVAE